MDCGCPAGYKLQNNSCKAITSCSQEYPVKKEYAWSYDSKNYVFDLCFPESIDFMRERNRTSRKYEHFVNDPYSNSSISFIVKELDGLATKEGLGEYEKVEFVVAFVQGLPYTFDNTSTGFDEYVRFPYETLYDDGGDCEDTSILMASILRQMGYGIILIHPVGHMAVGVKCNPSDFAAQGYNITYYNVGDYQYCYLETTGNNWKIGIIPEEYKNKEVKTFPIYDPAPDLVYSYNYSYNYGNQGTFVNTCTNISNLGSETAKNVTVYMALQTKDTSLVWDDYESNSFDINVDGSYWYCVEKLHAPYGKDFRILVRLYGANFNNLESSTQFFEWK